MGDPDRGEGDGQGSQREWRDGGFHVVTGSRGAYAAHLRRDSRANIVVCEHSPPYHRAELRCRAQLVTAGVDDAAKRIASRYLGRMAGAAYAERVGDDLLIRLEPDDLPDDLRGWDFADEFS